MGKRSREEQGALWIAAGDLPQSGGHPFYVQVNKILDAAGFDRFVESRCRAFYADKMGRPSLPPVMYFRMLLIGYFEGIDSERGIAWHLVDSRVFLNGFGTVCEDWGASCCCARISGAEYFTEIAGQSSHSRTTASPHRAGFFHGLIG